MKNIKFSFMVLMLSVILAACGNTTEGKQETTEPTAPESTTVDTTSQASAEVEVSDLDWNATPELGIVKGDYFKEEELFRQGHLATLEVVVNDGEFVAIEFNETTRPNYYIKYYQDVPKRLSEYNFSMGEAKGAAWIQGVLGVEKQMLETQSLTGEFDIVTGASNSVNQAMLPLAEKVVSQLDKTSTQKFYSIAEDLGGGLTGYLKVVIDEEGQIISCRYDEIFAATPDQIEDPALKKHYRTSKYESVEYSEPSRIGFNVQMDALNEKVVETQNM
ncbi:MAG: hypothetical protein ACRCS6_07930, partial [Turicibacter sp.]